MSIKTKLFHLWFRLSRPMTMGARIVLTNKNAQVLLIKHTYVPGWHFPGGGVDAGETCMQTAIRELHEETGIEVTDTPEFVGLYFNNKVSNRDHIALYKAASPVETIASFSNNEIADVGFFALDSLPDTVNQATKSRLAEIFNGQAQSTHW